MKERRTPTNNNNNQSRRSTTKTEGRRDQKPKQALNGKKGSGESRRRTDAAGAVVSDPNTGSSPEPSEVYESMVIHYVDDVNRSNKPSAMGDPNLDDHHHSSDLESKEESDTETTKDTASSQGDSATTADDEKGEITAVARMPKGGRSKHETGKSQSIRAGRISSTKKAGEGKKEPSRVTKQASLDVNAKSLKVATGPSSDSSEGVYGKEIDGVDEVSTSNHSVASDDETVDANDANEGEAELNQRMVEMEMRIGKLEEELKEVAALEISLYSVVPEHGSSSHKVHTPARRLSRLYIHACKHWSSENRATVARNTVSGLVLVSKSCGNDVPRLTFWLSNTVVLREIISQAFGCSLPFASLSRFAESNGSAKRNELKPSATLKWKGGSGGKQNNSLAQFGDDWQEPGTFMSALAKVESWIFSRIVESVWWQAMTPRMQSPQRGMSSAKANGKLLGPALGDQQQGSFSINLWKHAFQDASQRLCPVRAGGHECGCLPVIGRLVMEQCIARLDVAMFNAILRESAHEIPTDPVSDPIVDAKVLPIPAGDLSFGSGAQLKNSVGNWSRWLTEMFGMDADDPLKEGQNSGEDDEQRVVEPATKSFFLLNDLSDLLMLPKDMLMDRSIRKEVCPSIGLPLVKRILCNFTPDEFCPDAVPGAVLEALNAETIVERRLSGNPVRSFPYAAAPVVYRPPSSANVAEKVAEARSKSQLSRNVSAIQRKGYTSDEELEELDSPLLSIIETVSSSQDMASGNGNGKHKDHAGHTVTNVRYELLREVWSA